MHDDDKKVLDILKSKIGTLSSEKTSSKILVQFLEDPSFFIRFYFFLKAFIVKKPELRIAFVFVENFKGVPRARIKKYLQQIKSMRGVHRRWMKLYCSFGGSVELDYFYFSRELAKFEASKNLLLDIQSKEELINLKLNGVQVGDLLYDTYLRFRPAPTVDLSDPFLIELTEWMLVLHERIEKYLSENKIEVLLTGYTSYISHGLLARLALNRGIAVFSLGAHNQLVVQATPSFPYNKRNFWRYREQFAALENPEAARSLARDYLQIRFAGGVDPATFYMKESAYKFSDLPTGMELYSRPRGVIMGHDFFDSPHIYGKMLFPDLYEWAIFMLEKASESKGYFFYKPHPSSLPENKSIEADLEQRFPKVKFLDKRVSNASLAKQGIDLAFTVYGTIAHEFAYQGVPVVTAGDNPHSDYKFSYQASSQTELAKIIQDFEIPKIDFNKKSIEEFVFCHNQRLIAGEGQGLHFDLTMSDVAKLLQEPHYSRLLEDFTKNISENIVLSPNSKYPN